jgi:hypothetical protein
MNPNSCLQLLLPACITAFIIFSSSLMACSDPAHSQAPALRAGRIMPPATLVCDRNQLTSWTGEVTGYRRESDQTWIEIHTDEETVESTTIEHQGKADPVAHFLVWSQAFTERDWTRIEQSPGVLRPGMRAAAWICSDGKTPPVINWQPQQD